MQSIESLSDPYDDLAAESAAAEAGVRRDPQALLSTLWAMLARPDTGGASTIAAHRQHTADQLVAALRGAPGHQELAVALADLLTLGGGDPERFGHPARQACIEAVERLMLAQAADPDVRPRSERPRHVLPPIVLAALPSPSAGRRVHTILTKLGMEVHVADDVVGLDALLAETPADLVITEVGLLEGEVVPGAISLCDRVREHAMHRRTPILCLDNSPGVMNVRTTGPLQPRPGIRIGPRPVSRAEFVLRVRALLPLE
jgi:hypothetical protein